MTEHCTCKHYDKVDGTCPVHPTIPQSLIDEEMGVNRTSRAVELFLDCTEDGLGSLPLESFQAIREKYKRMEKALENDRYARACPENCKCSTCEALSFDPILPRPLSPISL